MVLVVVVIMVSLVEVETHHQHHLHKEILEDLGQQMVEQAVEVLLEQVPLDQIVQVAQVAPDLLSLLLHLPHNIMLLVVVELL